MNRRNILKYVGLSTIAAAIRDTSASAATSLRVPLSEEDSPSATASPAITAVFNQVGYQPASEKIATVLLQESADASFQIVPANVSSQDPQPVFQGKLTAPTVDAASGDRVAQADFSSLTTAGVYRLISQGKHSEPFAISGDVYREPLRLSIRAFYGQRCGCAVDLGGGYNHPPCHLSGAFHATSGRQGSTPNHGGWHDAGDYGRYVVNSGISTGTLLWAWELYPKALHNLTLGIPESGGKIPDYLAEIRWNLEWMLSLQDEDGGVWHKQTSEQFCAFILPQHDQLTSYIIGTGATPYKSTGATADLAAVAAIAARCYGKYDSAFAARCLEASKRAWSWAIAHPAIRFDNPHGIGTGDYGDKLLNDEILWASAELGRTTGDREYEQAFLAGVDALPPESAIEAPSWPNVAPLAYWTYLLAHRKGSDPLKSRILKQTNAAAQALVARRESSGYGNTLALTDFIWGSNSVAANQSLLLLIAHHLQPDKKLLDAALGNLHYLLGRNCFGSSWVTQVGTNPFQHPHHRPSAADGIAAPWPGLLSGGPNAHPGDAVAKNLPALPPMRMWIDDQAAYSLNEVAINWNAPLVFVLAAANALTS